MIYHVIKVLFNAYWKRSQKSTSVGNHVYKANKSMELFSLKLPELEKGLDVSATSCFRRIEVQEHLSLLPCYIGRLADGITDHVSGKVLRYVASLSGILVSYSKPVVLQSFGRIFDEQPHIHFDICYSAYVFKPTVGTILRGTVNKIGGDHVGCLVYDCFNASLIAPATPASKNGYSVGFSGKFRVGSKVWFRVTRLDIVGGILSITGEQVDFGNILGPDSEAMMDLRLPQAPVTPGDSSRHNHDELDTGASVVGDELREAGQAQQERPKRRKKHRQRKVSEEVCLGEVTVGERQVRRKSHKKRKRASSGLEDEVKHKPKKHKLNYN